jgi:hypothetical protein
MTWHENAARRGALIVGYVWQCQRHSIEATARAVLTGELRSFGILRDACGLPKLMLDRNGELVTPLFASSDEI